MKDKGAKMKRNAANDPTLVAQRFYDIKSAQKILFDAPIDRQMDQLINAVNN